MSKMKTISEDQTLPVQSQILLYQTEDGQTRIEVRLQDETVWLTQKLMADLFQVTVPTVNEHIKNIFDERELMPDGTIRKFRIVQKEGQRNVTRTVDYFNLDMIISMNEISYPTPEKSAKRLPISLPLNNMNSFISTGWQGKPNRNRLLTMPS